MPNSQALSLGGRSHPDHRAARKAYEKEHHINLDVKDVGLKAAVLVMMAGLACYPKIKSEADVIEREQRLRREKQGRDGWKSRGVREGREGRGRSLDDISRGEGRGGRGYGGRPLGPHPHDDRASSSSMRRSRRSSIDGSRRREFHRLERLDDDRSSTSARRSRRSEPNTRALLQYEPPRRTHEHGDSRTRRVDDDHRSSKRGIERERSSRSWEEGGSSSTSGSASDRTQDWLLGGYEYVSADEYGAHDYRRTAGRR